MWAVHWLGGVGGVWKDGFWIVWSDRKWIDFGGHGLPEKNGIICGAVMAEKRLEKSKVRYSAAYPTGAERFKIGCWDFAMGPFST